MEKLEMVKDNKKSTVYKIGNYEVRISEPSKSYVFLNGRNILYSNEEWGEENTGKMVQFNNVEIKNIKTNSKSYKRCLQGWKQIESNLENDFNRDKSQFNWR